METSTSDQHAQPGAGERIFAILTLFLTTEAVFPLLLRAGIMNAYSMLNAYWMVVYAISFYLIVVRCKVSFKTLFQEKLLYLLIVVAVLSILWSSSYTATFKGSMNLIGSVIFSVYLSYRYSLRQLLLLLGWALALCTVLSLLAVLFLPQLGVSDDGWRGIFAQKNILGRVMLVSILTWTFIATMKRIYVIPAMIQCILSMYLLLGSSSTTCLFMLLLLTPLLVIYRMVYFHKFLASTLFIYFVAICCTLGYWVATNYEQLLLAFNRDPTLTGRVELWENVFHMILANPWLGYGYSGFWNGWNGPSANVWSVIRWEPLFSHNGYLEVALQVGSLGLIVLVSSLVATVVNAVKVVLAEKQFIYMFYLIFPVLTIVYNFSEHTFLKSNFLFWIVYMVISLKVHGSFEQQRVRRVNHGPVSQYYNSNPEPSRASP